MSEGHWPSVRESSPIEQARVEFPRKLRRLGGAAASDALTGVAICALREGTPDRFLSQLAALRGLVDDVEAAFRAAWGKPIERRS